MKDWKAIAKANGLDLPAQEMDKIADTLKNLDDAFRPLAHGLSPDIEPATGFQVEEAE
jgi:hypothetical protein